MPKVVERITSIKTLQFTMRVWIDVSDVEDSPSRVHERLHSVRVMFPKFVEGCKFTDDARRAVEQQLLLTNLQNYVSAFEILDGMGDGYVQYPHWP